ncbi:hypothetical protein H0H93_014238 [Arthromyces matolae]|nr:hypothetical protein H0H93_014238 [Arthromyces matolae]
MSLPATRVHCPICKVEFTGVPYKKAKNLKDHHVRTCVKIADVEYVNGKVTLHRDDATNAFTCTCNIYPDGHSFVSILSLKQHVANSGCTFAGQFEEDNEAILGRMGFVYNPDIRCVICVSCKVAVAPDHVHKHILDKHKDSGVSAPKDRVAYVLRGLDLSPGLPDLALNTVRDEIPGLVVHNALKCNLCFKIYGTEGSITKHHRTSHPGPLPQQWSTVIAQRLDNAMHSTWFQVTPREQPSDSLSTISQIIQTVRQQQQENDKDHPIGNSVDPRLVSPWIRSTLWLELIENRDVNELIKLVALPSKDEFPGLTDGIKWVFMTASSLFGEIPELTLQRLNTPDPIKSGINNTPLHKHQDHAERMNTYIRPVVRLAAMLLRSSVALILDLPEDVRKRIEKLRKSLSTDNTPQKLRDIGTRAFHLLLQLWTRIWPRGGSMSTPFSDPTIISLALSMLQNDGSFKHPKYTTGPIAQFEYCIRTLFAMHLHDRVDKNPTSTYAQETDTLSFWFTEKQKEDTTFNSLRSLQHRASSIAQATMSLPQVWWTDRPKFMEMLYHGERIHFDNIRKTFIELEQRLVDCYDNNVLLQTSVYVKYGHLRDDLSNTSVGYSFMSDPANPFGKDRDCLLRAFLERPDLKNRFVAYTNSDGSIEWNKMALRKWLYDYATFEGLLLVRAQMLGGSPGRGTEITAMTFKNIPTSTHRNCVVFGKFLAMLVTYHKGTAMSGQEKLIPHAFDGLTSDLIIQDLAVARPFAELAAFICYPDKFEVRRLYRDHLFVNNAKLFTSDDVSRIMQRLTEPIIGVKLGLQAWRQVSIAYRRKRCSDLEDLIDDDQEDTFGALQATHSRRMENRVYGLSADALSGVPEDFLPGFLEASTRWQIESRAVPGGLGLPYRDCRAVNFDSLVSSGAIKSSNGTSDSTSIQKQLREMKEDILNEMHSQFKQLTLLVSNELRNTAVVPPPPDTPTPISTHLNLNPQLPTPIEAPTQKKTLRHRGPAKPILQSSSPIRRRVSDPPSLDSITEAITPVLDDEQGRLSYGTKNQIKRRRDANFLTFETGKMASAVQPIINDETDDEDDVPGNIGDDEDGGEFTLTSSDMEDGVVGGLSNDDWNAEALAGLRQVLKNVSAVWSCPEQEEAVVAVLKRQTDVLAILRTGAGKTMLALIPLVVDRKLAMEANDQGNRPPTVTVVILPLKSLISDYKRKLEAMSIPFEHYTHDTRITGSCGLILVSVDMARTAGWKQAIGEVDDRVGVSRFVIDECQLGFTSDDFRPSLQNLAEIRSLPVQLVLLSATVPPGTVNLVRSTWLLTPDSITIRMCTDRPELRYIIHPSTRKTVEETVKVVRKHMEQGVAERDRVLVFVSFKDDEGRPIAKALDCDFYEGGGSLTDLERVAVYNRWIQGVNKVMVCTHAFGAGNDYPHVRLVVHAGTPKQMISYIQEVGRGGRDGQWADCILIPSQKARKEPSSTSIDHRGHTAVHDMIYSSGNECIRYLLTLFSDGNGVRCADVQGCPKCSRCVQRFAASNPRPPITASQSSSTSTVLTKRRHSTVTAEGSNFRQCMVAAKKNKIERSITADEYTNRVLASLALFASTCVACFFVGTESSSKHAITDCETLERYIPGTHIRDFKEWQRRLRYDRNVHGKICYFCHVPQLNDDLHGTIMKDGGGCLDAHRDIIAPLGFLLWTVPEWRVRMQDHFGRSWTTLGQFTDWLNARSQVAIHPTNLVAVFMWYTSVVEENGSRSDFI